MPRKTSFMAAVTGMACDIKTPNNVFGISIVGLPQNFSGKALESILIDLDMFEAVWEQGTAEVEYNGVTRSQECLNLYFKHAIASEAILPSITDAIDAMLEADNIDLRDRNYDFYPIHENLFRIVEKRCKLQYQGGAPSHDPS